MALKTVVKVSGINNLSDARYCAGMSVEFLGFSPESTSENYTELAKYQEITNWLSGVKYVGELTKSPQENLAEYNFDAFQINQIDLISELKKFKKPLFFTFKVEKITDLDGFVNLARTHSSDVDYFLLESKTLTVENSAKTLQNLCTEFPIILDFADVNAENANDILTQIQPDGIGLKGGNEISPGLNDFDGLADVLESLEEEEVW